MLTALVIQAPKCERNARLCKWARTRIAHKKRVSRLAQPVGETIAEPFRASPTEAPTKKTSAGKRDEAKELPKLVEISASCPGKGRISMRSPCNCLSNRLPLFYRAT